MNTFLLNSPIQRDWKHYDPLVDTNTLSLIPEFEFRVEGDRILGICLDDSNFSKFTIRRTHFLVDPEDDVEWKAQELTRQTIAGINPCGAEFWDPSWDEPSWRPKWD